MAGRARKGGTSTSKFGSPGRASHNATIFYNSRLYEGFERGRAVAGPAENEIRAQYVNRVYCKDSRRMDELPDGCVHLMITSPPYNASKEYDQDLNLGEYLRLLEEVWRESYRALAPGGRACINVANLGRRPYLPMHVDVIHSMLSIGFQMRGEIIWNKGSSAAPSTAWGSWKSASNPVLRDVHEYILVFSKGAFSRKASCGESTITREEFLEWTRSVWSFPAVTARQVGHPAPFPEELPHRLIQLYSFKGDLVLDPFAGSGTTCVAALRDGRRFVGYEINAAYVQLAETRLRAL